MAASERQIRANQLNALRSTGPRTPAGKGISRANSYKHGLTGDGVVVPCDERGQVAARVAWVQGSLAPEGDPVSMILAQQVAFLSVRQERCFDHIEAVTEERVRNAEAEHDDARRSAAEHLLGHIGDESITSRRRLLATPEGTDLLIRTLEDLRGDVGTGTHTRWTDYHGAKLEQYLGQRAGMVPIPRCAALSDLIVRNDLAGLDPAEVAHLGPDVATRLAWALPELARLIDAEVARLRDHRAAMDPSRAGASRAGAGRRATGGADKELVRLQRYEAATHRALVRAVREVEAHRAPRGLADPAASSAATQAALAARPEPAVVVTSPQRRAELASFSRNVLAPPLPDYTSTITIGKSPRTAPVQRVTPPRPPRYTV